MAAKGERATKPVKARPKSITRFSFRYFFAIRPPARVFLNEHCILDTSGLSPDEQGKFIEALSTEIMSKKKSSKESQNRIVIFDECHMPWPDGFLGSDQAQYTKELLTEGRNIGVRFIGITQSPATCDKLPITLAQQRYFFCISEPKDVEYVKGFVGKWLIYQRFSGVPSIQGV